MESVYKQTTKAINRDEWSRVVDAAQDPGHRDAVQEFLTRADLSGDIPAALDQQVLAPRRAAGATGEQCAYILCNLGFAALAVAATKGSAEFVLACGRLVGQLAPDSPDLALRRHFLSAKAGLVVAALADQPHLLWHDAAERCTAYLSALEFHLEALPAGSVGPNATAAYSFAAQLVSRLQKLGAVEHHACEVSKLIEVALGLASRLPSTLVSGMWRTLIPGTDAGVFLRQAGAAAELSLQTDRQSPHHAERGLAYIDEILSRATPPPSPGIDPIRQLRAELLLLSGRHTDAFEQAEALASSPDAAVREHAVAIRARCELSTGNPGKAAELLREVSPATDQALLNWQAAWIGDADDSFWASQTGAFPRLAEQHVIWRLQAVAAAAADDTPEFLDAANRSTGYLADSLFRDRRQWVERMRTVIGKNPANATRGRVLPEHHAITRTTVADLVPMLALDDIIAQLVDGTALLQVVNTPEGILTWVARSRDGAVSLTVAPHRPNAKRLCELQKTWNRACFDALPHGASAADNEAQATVLFAKLMDEIRRNWGDLLQELVDDGVTQLLLIGDDLVDIPLHATPTGSGNERLIDRVPVSYAPSLYSLRDCLSRRSAGESRRKGVILRSLSDAAADAPNAVAAELATEKCLLAPEAASFWTDAAAARVLHIVARTTHDARKPFASLLGAGWLDLGVAELIAGLDLPRCELVSMLDAESVLPSTLRAPGLDLTTLLLAAGARSVLASTWVVREDLAAELTGMFFRGWVSGQAPAVAFQQALRGLRAARPTLPDSCWAGMRLVGAP